jgi:hypothetical protein
MYIYVVKAHSFAIDHRTWKTGLPVRSVILKPCAGRLVVGWVTTSEYLLMIVFAPPLFSTSLLFSVYGWKPIGAILLAELFYILRLSVIRRLAECVRSGIYIGGGDEH